ncbi:MAG: hypothetical protein EOP83_15705 [Verrucomicrobiaceae bacterium]|nr:MAG: hypothetical protein EOP83_15705 [Verrucomicrobiaceae bacterium]
MALVATCPEKLQEKCFEILLNAYVNGSTPKQTAPAAAAVIQSANTPQQNGAVPNQIPDVIRPKLVSLAGRNKIALDKAAALFDFNTDPFTLHAYVAPGAKKAEKARNVALALALKNYLSTGAWSTDWLEFRGACIDQNCFDSANISSSLGKSGHFKKHAQADGIVLSSQGVAAAESLFASLAGGASE